jgi:RNA methyltransferase, TrmH family
LLRTALALGWDGALLLPGCVSILNDKVLRASRGAVFKLPLAMASVDEWEELARTHDLVCIAGDPHSTPGQQIVKAAPTEGNTQRRLPSLEDVEAAGERMRCCLVLGSEGQGLSADVLAQCTPVAIPMPGDMESLNVAAAGAVMMFALSGGAPGLLRDLYTADNHAHPA